ncbi:MAG: hypothetical protein JRG91_12560, partial [Deltaproteobacteria bacterium]|nr:hypothetical protein [Deltaproteobacteria bacterium]
MARLRRGELPAPGAWSGWCETIRSRGLQGESIGGIASRLGLAWPGSRSAEPVSAFLVPRPELIASLRAVGPKKTLVIVSCIRQLAETDPGDVRTPPEVLASLTDHLRERQRDVLHRRFGIGSGDRCTLEVIGRAYGLTRERIR